MNKSNFITSLNGMGFVYKTETGHETKSRIDLNNDCEPPIHQIVTTILRVQEAQLKKMSEDYQAQSEINLGNFVREFEEKWMLELEKYKILIKDIQDQIDALKQLNNGVSEINDRNKETYTLDG